MSNDLSDEVREFVSRVADPGSLWEWRWPVDPEKPDGGQIVAILDIRSTKTDYTVAIDWWYMSKMFQDWRPPGVELDSNVPPQVFYDAVKAGKLVELQRVRHCDSDEEIVRQQLVRFMNEDRETFATEELIDACNADRRHPQIGDRRITSALYRLYLGHMVSWDDDHLGTKTLIRITGRGRTELLRPFTN